MFRNRWPLAVLLFGLLVATFAIAVRQAARAQEQPAAPAQLTIQQCMEDLDYLRTINRLDPTAEQLAKLVEALNACDLQRRQAETTRSQAAPQALVDVRAKAIRGEALPQGEAFDLLGEELARQFALSERSLDQARQQCSEQLKTIFTEQQLRRFGREGPLREVDDFMAELAVSRGLPDAGWVEWQQRAVPELARMIVARDPKNTKAFEVASKFLEDARALSDADFGAQKDPLTQKLEQLVLPADFKPETDTAEAARRLGWFLLERPRSAAILQEMLKARGGA